MTEQRCPCCGHLVKAVFCPGSGTGAASHLEPDESETERRILELQAMLAWLKLRFAPVEVAAVLGLSLADLGLLRSAVCGEAIDACWHALEATRR